jgi:hypothetical protein
MSGPLIPTYLSHSYRPEDREINRRLWDYFWSEGFAFTVDPKSPEQLSIPHLELMMLRSACYVAIVPYRADQERYRTSPYIVFEHNMAVRAKKPLLVIAEPQVAGHPFDPSRLHVFRDGDPDHPVKLRQLMQELREQSSPYAHRAGHVLGSVGLVLPAGRVYDRAREAIRAVLEAAGYEVHAIRHDPGRGPDFSEVDRHDFIVIDIRARDMTSGLYYRFVPTIRLGYKPRSAGAGALPAMFRDDALERAGGSAQNVIWWSDEEDLVARLRPVVDKMQRPRRQFRSHDEGVGYFQSLGRSAQGPVFISNANGQNEFARHLSRGLDLSNIAFFHYRYNNTIPMGTVWEGQLFEHLRSSRLFVQLNTADYWESSLCKREFRLAQRLAGKGRLRVYRYFLDETSAAAGRGERLQGRDLIGLPVDEQLRQILGDIDRYLTVGEDKAS